MRYIITVSWVSPSSIHNAEKNNENTIGNGLFPWSPSHLMFLTASPSWHLGCTCVHTCKCMLLWWSWQSPPFLLSHVTDWAMVHSHCILSTLADGFSNSNLSLSLRDCYATLPDQLLPSEGHKLMSRRSLSSCDTVQTPRGKRENPGFCHHWKFSFWFFRKYIQGC